MPKALKIVHIVREAETRGGVSGVVQALDTSLRQMGISSRILSRPKRQKGGSRLVGKVHLLIDVVRFSVSATIAARGLRQDSDVVTIVHNDGLVGDVYVDHGLHKAVVANKPSLLLRNPLHGFLLVREEIRHRFRLYRHMVFLSAFSRSQFLKYFPGSSNISYSMIPNGVDLDRFRMRPDIEPSTDGLRLIFVGHEYERKGLIWIIRSLAQLDKAVRLTVVGGSGEEIAAARASAAEIGVADRVTFLGRRFDIEEILIEHDVMLLPSAFESWPLVVLEAMACGLPVLSTPVGCASEVIVEGETGYIIRQDAVDIAGKLQSLLDAPDRLPAMRRAARSMAEQYGWPQIAGRYLELAERIRSARTA